MAILNTVIAPSTRAPILVPNTSSVVKNATMTIGARSTLSGPTCTTVLPCQSMSRMKSLR